MHLHTHYIVFCFRVGGKVCKLNGNVTDDFMPGQYHSMDFNVCNIETRNMSNKYKKLSPLTVCIYLFKMTPVF